MDPAAEDLTNNTLSRIGTLFGRLTYLSSLWDHKASAHRHDGLAQIHGKAACRKALRQAHEAAFREWLSLPIADKHRDFKAYIAAQITGPFNGGSSAYRLVPQGARRSEQALFTAEMEILLQLVGRR